MSLFVRLIVCLCKGLCLCLCLWFIAYVSTCLCPNVFFFVTEREHKRFLCEEESLLFYVCVLTWDIA